MTTKILALTDALGSKVQLVGDDLFSCALFFCPAIASIRSASLR